MTKTETVRLYTAYRSVGYDHQAAQGHVLETAIEEAQRAHGVGSHQVGTAVSRAVKHCTQALA